MRLRQRKRTDKGEPQRQLKTQGPSASTRAFSFGAKSNNRMKTERETERMPSWEELPVLAVLGTHLRPKSRLEQLAGKRKVSQQEPVQRLRTRSNFCRSSTTSETT